MTAIYIQMFAALIFVILIIGAVGYVMRKKQDRFGVMSVVGYQPLGPKKGVTALKVGGEILLIGVTQNDMRLLKVIKEGELEIESPDSFKSRLDKFKRPGALN
ncbi:MAG: flagellar biosynthetic protein FliO [Nitrospira sp.]|nr:flagellar biosynthetic protein FliO [bacterium]MBL7048059.1 flagellar biosynthetic protein FliO [Nitrospira sp.]